MNLAGFTKKFYLNNKTKLERNFPGIHLQKIKSELFELHQPLFTEMSQFFNALYTDFDKKKIDLFFIALLEGVPFEYINKKRFFYQSEFTLNSSVLIPRNETEILVEMAVDELRKWDCKTKDVLKVCDVCTGSGCIIISILRDFGKPLNALATDISKEALEISQKNNFNLRYSYPKESSCDFLLTDRLEKIKEKFHVITCNPPYIKEKKDKKLVHHQVLEHEPSLALFLSDENYDDWFLHLFKGVHRSLLDGGVFIMEGHENHLSSLKERALELEWSRLEVIKDYFDRNRFLILKK